jgi:CheY-like chemotaxis protein
MGCKPFGVENGQECVDLHRDVMTRSPSSKTQHNLFTGGAAQFSSQAAASSAAFISTAQQQLTAGGFDVSHSSSPFDIILMDGSMPGMSPSIRNTFGRHDVVWLRAD